MRSKSHRMGVGPVLAGTILMFFAMPNAPAQTLPAVTEPDGLRAIHLLRGELVDSFNKGDVERLMSHLDPDVVITWQNAEVCRGPQAVKAYYGRMMSGPNRIVSELSANPVVDDRHVYGDWAVSWGNLNDNYVLNDGSTFRFDSRFTATIARRGEVWKVTSFHASINAFDNPILKVVGKKVGTWVGIGCGLGGIIIGLVIGMVLRRPKAAAGPTGTA
jgi:ketosteroid isomerase-like protein